MKIYEAVQKLIVGGTQTDTHTQTDRQTGDLRSLLSFLESRLTVSIKRPLNPLNVLTTYIPFI
jgi:hypothetical protein